MADTFLSEDLVREILLRLPSVTSAVRLSCVCKLWRDIIFRDPGFVNKFCSAEKKDPFVVFQMRTCHGYLVRTHNSLTSGRLKFPDEQRTKRFVIGSCNGIICFQVSRDETDHVDLYNPISREYRKLPPPHRAAGFLSVTKSSVYGFGFDSSSGDYKVVYINKKDHQVEVYSLGTSSWRKLDVNLGFNIYKDQTSSAFVYVNGCCYWTVSSEISMFLTFDFRTETFGLVNLPIVARDMQHVFLGELDNCVAVCVSNLGYRTQVWVMSERGDDSWIKKFSVNRSACYDVWSWAYDTRLFEFKLDEKVMALTKEEGMNAINRVFRVDGPFLLRSITFKPSLMPLGSGYFMPI